MKILVTGAAGFIGSKITHLLAERGDDVVGIDNINDYYDVRLEYGRLQYLEMGKEAKKELLPMQPSDVYMTNADTTKLEMEIGYFIVPLTLRR